MATRAKSDEQTPSNTRLWDVLGKTDPSHTKPFKRSGGFSGTAVKPMWQNKQLTETFGPCGLGWGFDKPDFQIQPGAKGETLVYCIVTAWYVDPATGETAHVYGVGGDKVVVTYSSGPASDDEAFKKAFTDAIGNAFKFVGVAADVHMGFFDDNKYVSAVREEFEQRADPFNERIEKIGVAMRNAASLEEVTKARTDLGLDALIEELKGANRLEDASLLTTTYKAARSKHTTRPKVVEKDAAPPPAPVEAEA